MSRRRPTQAGTAGEYNRGCTRISLCSAVIMVWRSIRAGGDTKTRKSCRLRWRGLDRNGTELSERQQEILQFLLELLVSLVGCLLSTREAGRWLCLSAHGILLCIEPGRARNAVSQLRKGTLEYCVLALLRDGQRYGFELVRTLSETDGLLVSEGTIYPLLSRLRRDRLVSTSWQESEAGPPRRYYQLTDAGKRALADFSDEWARFRNAVDALVTTQGEQGDERAY